MGSEAEERATVDAVSWGCVRGLSTVVDGGNVTESCVACDSFADSSDEEMMGSSSGVSKGVSLTEPCYAKEFKVDLNTIEMFILA